MVHDIYVFRIHSKGFERFCTTAVYKRNTDIISQSNHINHSEQQHRDEGEKFPQTPL